MRAGDIQAACLWQILKWIAVSYLSSLSVKWVKHLHIKSSHFLEVSFFSYFKTSIAWGNQLIKIRKNLSIVGYIVGFPLDHDVSINHTGVATWLTNEQKSTTWALLWDMTSDLQIWTFYTFTKSKYSLLIHVVRIHLFLHDLQTFSPQFSVIQTIANYSSEESKWQLKV